MPGQRVATKQIWTYCRILLHSAPWATIAALLACMWQHLSTVMATAPKLAISLTTLCRGPWTMCW